MEIFWEVVSVQSLLTLVMLILLQAVLGFDNLLYISIESQRVDESSQSYVRKLGIFLAIFLRIALLFVIYFAIRYLQKPAFHIDLAYIGLEGKFRGEFSVHSLIVLAGGAFIIYTAIKEIHHLLAVEHIENEGKQSSKRPVGVAVFWIVIMNLVFSFDSILSAIALTGSSHTATRAVEEPLYTNFYSPLIVMSIAVILSGILMIWLADHVANFLKKNRMYEILGLFILFIVGVMLVTDGGHLGHVYILGNEVTKMTNATFYFVLAILVIVDLIQSRYQRKLEKRRTLEVDGKLAVPTQSNS